MKNDEMKVKRFVRASSIFQSKKSAADDLIKHQGARGKIIMPDFCIEDAENLEWFAPLVAILPEEESIRNVDTEIKEADIEDTAKHRNNVTMYKDENEVDPYFRCK